MKNFSCGNSNGTFKDCKTINSIDLSFWNSKTLFLEFGKSFFPETASELFVKISSSQNFSTTHLNSRSVVHFVQFEVGIRS